MVRAFIGYQGDKSVGAEDPVRLYFFVGCRQASQSFYGPVLLYDTAYLVIRK